MSDVTVAPEGSAPPAAPVNEVQIDQSPVSAPSPIGSQAPEKPVSEHRPERRTQDRRDSIKEAFERAKNPPPKPAPKPTPPAAEAKPGHNRPPEETPKETINLKQRPEDQKVEQPRDKGRFAPREQPPAQAQQPPAQAQQPQQQPKQLPANAPYREPPARMAEHGKREWANTPESVRGEVHRVQQEFAKAYNYYKADYEAFKPIKQFHALAQEHGTTLEKALTNYVSMEQKLRADPIAGLDIIVNNLGITDPQTGQRIGLRDIAYYVLNQSPEQLRQVQQGNQQQAAAHQIGALHQELTGLKQTLQQMHTQQQFTYTRSAVDQFADSHPRFDELGPIIEQELKFGFDLETAYRRAEALRPATQAAQTRQSPPAQTRTADKSISGAPDVTGSNPASRRNGKTVGRREAIQAAINRVGGL